MAAVTSERILQGLLLALAAWWILGVDLAFCPTAGIFGVPCPSCGLTRAAVALLFGDWHEATALHPCVIPALAYLAFVGIAWTRGRHSNQVRRLVTWSGLLLFFAMTLTWLARFLGYFGGPVAVVAWRF